MDALETPCRRICRQDRTAGVCIGCGRTVPEIIGWVRLDPAERQAILVRLPARLEALRTEPAERREDPEDRPIEAR